MYHMTGFCTGRQSFRQALLFLEMRFEIFIMWLTSPSLEISCFILQGVSSHSGNMAESQEGNCKYCSVLVLQRWIVFLILKGVARWRNKLLLLSAGICWGLEFIRSKELLRRESWVHPEARKQKNSLVKRKSSSVKIGKNTSAPLPSP